MITIWNFTTESEKGLNNKESYGKNVGLKLVLVIVNINLNQNNYRSILTSPKLLNVLM